MKICIVDDDKLVSLSLKTILDINENIDVTGIGNSGLEALELYESHKPDVMLMDIRMGEMSGLEASREILSKHPEARILLLTTFSDDEYIIQALRIGVKGYILKQNFESIAPALSAVYNGQTVFGDEITTRLPSLVGNFHETTEVESFPPEITEKEMDIVRKVADGLNNREIAEQLFLSEGTVRNYLSSILEKLELRDRTQLAIYYYKTLSS